MSELGEKARFKKRVRDITVHFNSPVSERFLDAKPGDEVEHVTRRHFVDPFLRALGWDLSALDRDMIEEARTTGEATLRLDYLGVNSETRTPVLIVEAKPWAAPFISPSRTREGYVDTGSDEFNSLISVAIEHHKSGGEPKSSPATMEWMGYLDQLHRYVTAVRDESEHTVSRVAILSGQWLVIFCDPKAVFLTPGKVSEAVIKVYRQEQLVTHAEEIFDHLARDKIANTVPERIRPSLLERYIRSSDIKRTFRALWVSSASVGTPWTRRPNIDIYVAVVLERRDKALVTVIDESLQAQSMPHNYADLSKHISAVESEFEELLRRISRELKCKLAPSDVDEFPGFNWRKIGEDVSASRLARETRIDLLRINTDPEEFLLVIGSATHFLLGRSVIDDCMFHDWTKCRNGRQACGQSPIMSRSVDPKSFFMSGEEHHCAHQIIHDRRNARCKIDAFEEFLCCRACALQSFCWKEDELEALPCGEKVQGCGA